MANGNAESIIDAKLAAAFNAAPKTKQKKALSAFRQALQETKPAKNETAHLSKKESELLRRINSNLSPEKQRRYDELRRKREDETLTDAEYQELLEFVSDIQTIWADRLQAIAELAELRGLSPKQLMKQLELEPRPYYGD